MGGVKVKWDFTIISKAASKAMPPKDAIQHSRASNIIACQATPVSNDRLRTANPYHVN